MIGISSFNDIPWPTEDWSRSTPEEHGMDSVRLVEMLNAMRDRVRDIESLLRIRNGRLLLEAYRYPYHPDTLHSLMSCTKSVTSAMIGIAIGQGTIGGDQPARGGVLSRMRGSSLCLTNHSATRQGRALSTTPAAPTCFQLFCRVR